MLWPNNRHHLVQSSQEKKYKSNRLQRIEKYLIDHLNKNNIMSLPNINGSQQAIEVLCGEQLAIDRLAAGSIQSDSLKLIYQTFVNISYVVFISGIAVTLTTDGQTRENFINYLGKDTSLAYLITITVIGVISYSLRKAYGTDKRYAPATKKIINFVEDILKEAVFILVIVYVSQFVYQNSGIVSLTAAFILYVVSLVLFTAIFLIKWIYFLWGPGKDNVDPWSVKPVVEASFLSQDQRNAVLSLANDFIQRKKSQIKLNGGAPQMQPEIVSQRQIVLQ